MVTLTFEDDEFARLVELSARVMAAKRLGAAAESWAGVLRILYGHIDHPEPEELQRMINERLQPILVEFQQMDELHSLLRDTFGG